MYVRVDGPKCYCWETCCECEAVLRTRGAIKRNELVRMHSCTTVPSVVNNRAYRQIHMNGQTDKTDSESTKKDGTDPTASPCSLLCLIYCTTEDLLLCTLSTLLSCHASYVLYLTVSLHMPEV